MNTNGSSEDVVGVRRVLVGFDGSDGAARALRWARAEAERWTAPLVVIRAWEFTPLVAATHAPTGIDELGALMADHARREVVEVIGVEPDGENVLLEVVQGAPVEILCAASEPDDLLVVGSRGMGGFKGLLLGSVSHQVSLHARCPVVIVRSD